MTALKPSFGFLREYQRQVKEGLILAPGIDPIAHCALGITGEAGEVADMIKKSQYERRKEYLAHEMLLELGDVIWYATALLEQHGLTLAQAIDANITKLMIRHPNGRYDLNKLYAAE
jgi:NTP pyrophosphatase (non-canonical NTP hydrolase)